jgi:hypothetical protein
MKFPSVFASAIYTIVLVMAKSSGLSNDMFTGWSPIVDKNQSLTVLIRVEVEGKPPGYGSGIIIKPGHVLTAKHILPDIATRENGTFLIKALVGWDDPSIDFSQGQNLDIDYTSERYDLAILSYRSIHSHEQYAFAGASPHLGESVLVMGYPGGGNLTCTSGIASRKAEDGKYATDAAVGIGNSGGPVFGTSGALLGILIEGSRRDNDGRIILGYFLTTETISHELSETRSLVRLTSTPPPLVPILPVHKIIFAYSVDDEKTDHPTVTPTDTSFEHSFRAQDGFRITSAAFQSSSANHVIKAPDVTIVEGGARVVVRFTLQSGPLFDQWRGWIVGSVTTTQERQ